MPQNTPPDRPAPVLFDAYGHKVPNGAAKTPQIVPITGSMADLVLKTRPQDV